MENESNFSIADLLNKWEQTCEDSPVENYPSRPRYQIKQEEIYTYTSNYYHVIDYLERISPEDGESPEKILTVANGPADEYQFIHLTGNWVQTDVYINALVSIDPKIKWCLASDVNGLYLDKRACEINDKNGYIVVNPHFLMKTSTLGSFNYCKRMMFFRETHRYSDPTLFSVYGRLTNAVLTKYIENLHEGKDITAEELADEYLAHYKNMILLIPDYEKEIKDQIHRFAESIDKDKYKFGLALVKEKIRKRYYSTKCFPGVDVRKLVTDETIWSFNKGLVGRPTCVSTIKGIPDLNPAEKMQYSDLEIEQLVPVEIVSSLSNDQPNYVKSGHVLITSAYLQLLKEKYPDYGANYGFIWYLNRQNLGNSRFLVHPSKNDQFGFFSVRNSTVLSVCTNNPLPIHPSYYEYCENCISKAACALYDRMQDSREYIETIDEVLPKTMCDFSTNSSRQFFTKYNSINFMQARNVMKCFMLICTMSPDERDRKGFVALNLEVFEKEFIIDPSNSISTIYFFKLRPKVPGSLYRYKFIKNDTVLITNDGRFPIICMGSVTGLNDEYVQIKTYQSDMLEGQIVAADFCHSSKWFEAENASLTQLLTNENYAHLRNLLVDERKPRFLKQKANFDETGLNQRQKLAISVALKANDYALINAPHGTGRFAILFRIIHAKLKTCRNILVAPYFYHSLNRICKGLEKLGIEFMIGGKIEKVKEELHYRFESKMLENCMTPDEVEEVLSNVRVFVIPNAAKQFDLLTQRKFDFSILFEASRLPVLRSIPTLVSSQSFVLFGDLVLDSKTDSIYEHFARISPHIVVNLWDVYDTEPAITGFARIIWGNELICHSHHAAIDLSALKVLNHNIRKLFKDILTMDKPVVFVNTNNFASSIMIAVAAGLVYEHIDLIAKDTVLPQISTSLYRCRVEGELVFSRFHKFMMDAAACVLPFNASSVLSIRRDTLISVVDDCDPDVLKLSLAVTRRKLIIIGKSHILSTSPLWSTLINQLPKEWFINFPDEILEEEQSPFLKVATLFSNSALPISTLSNIGKI